MEAMNKIRQYLKLIESYLCELDADSSEDKQEQVTDAGVDLFAMIKACIKKCDCTNCKARKQDAAKVTDAEVWTSSDGLPDIDHPAGCDCPVCKGIRDAELRKRRAEMRTDVTEIIQKSREDNVWPSWSARVRICNPHCRCDDCLADEVADRAKIRGCGPHCECDDCLEDRDTQMRRDS